MPLINDVINKVKKATHEDYQVYKPKKDNLNKTRNVTASKSM